MSNGKIVDPVVLVNPETSAKNNSTSSRNSYSFLSNTWTFDSSEITTVNNNTVNNTDNNSKQDTIKKTETKNSENGLSKAIQENIILISLSTIAITYIIVRIIRKK